MEVSIKPFSEADREQVVQGLTDLQNFEVPLHDSRVASDVVMAGQYLDELLAAVRDKRGALLCSHVGNEVAGFVVGWVEHEENINETPDSNTFGYLSDALVFEPYRGQGIFKALSGALEKHFGQFPDITRIRLNTLANNEKAQRAYRAAGYGEYEIVFEKKVQSQV